MELPPPNMEMPPAPPATGAPAGTLPPPSVSVDPGGDPSKATPPTGGPQPLVPVPPAGPPPAPGVPTLPIPQPGSGGAGVPPIRAPGAGTAGANGVSPGSTPVRPLPAVGGSLPVRATQNVTLEAVCPDTIVFGQEFRYDLVVRNGGTAAVAGVRV